MTFSIHVPGPPVAKGRPRFLKHGGTYTPPKTAAYEKMVKQLAAIKMGSRAPLEGPVRVRVSAFLPVPPSWTKRRRTAALRGEALPIGRGSGDADNYAKGAVDAMNGIVFKDDCQIVELTAVKRYFDQPGLTIRVEEVE